MDIVGRQTESGVFPAYIKTLKKVIKDIAIGKSTEVEELLEEIRSAFGLGAAAVYDTSDYNAITYTKDFPQGLMSVKFMGNASYKALVAVDNVIVINNLDSIEREDKAVYRKLYDAGCRSYVSVFLSDNTGTEYIFVFYMLGEKHKWSSVEIDYLTMLSEVIYGALKK